MTDRMVRMPKNKTKKPKFIFLDVLINRSMVNKPKRKENKKPAIASFEK